MADAARATYSEPPQPDARRFGRYTLRYRVAHGGMASVYLAQLKSGPKFQKWVAVKLVHPRMEHDDRFVGMFMHEAQLLSRLEHPHVCSVLDFGQADGTHFIAMEYLHGESLASVIRRSEVENEPIPMVVAARIVSDIAYGLNAAHELKNEDGTSAGVVHRDVSPQNVFVLYQGLSKIVDFGIAQSKTREELTRTGELKGKFHYMSPEQVNQEAMDGRSDVFALGIVLWEATVGGGVRLFKRDRDLDTLLAVINEPIPKPSEKVPDYPPALEAIVMRALERDPGKRFQTMEEMARALGAYIASAGGADHAAVSDWMKRIFDDRMRARDELLKNDGTTNEVAVVELESNSNSVVPVRSSEANTAIAKPRIVGRERRDDTPDAPIVLPQAPAPPPRSNVTLAGLGVAALLLVAVIAWLARSEPPPVAHPTPPPALPPTTVAIVPTTLAPPTSVAVVTPPSSAPAVTVAPPATRTHSRARPTPTTAPATIVHESPPPTTSTPHVGPHIMTNFEEME
jgi:serine/threonine-protein kinase